MATEFRFPDVGEGIAEGEIVKWRVREGETVKADQVLLEIETDKAVVEIPSPRSGTIARLHHKQGDTVKVGEVLVTIADAGEKISAAKADSKQTESETQVQLKKERASKQTSSNTFVGESDHYSSSVVGKLEESDEVITEEITPSSPAKQAAGVAATPAVRRLARDMHVDISALKGSGAGSRVTEEDVRRAAQQKGVTEIQPAVTTSKRYDHHGDVERIPLKGVRKAIAEHMTKSMYTAVHVTHMDEADVTELVKLREKEKPNAEKKKIKLTYMPFIVKAVIIALREHPLMNASLDDEHQEIIVKKYYNMGIAVDTPDGLIVPVVRDADRKNMLQIAKEIQDKAERAQARKLDIDEMKGQSFTITNIGVLGGVFATPVINWPDVAILALGKIYDKVVYKDEKIQVRKHLPFSLTFDHRVVDGAEAARCANKIKENLEDTNMLMMEE